jgi:hypothetical protein
MQNLDSKLRAERASPATNEVLLKLNQGYLTSRVAIDKTGITVALPQVYANQRLPQGGCNLLRTRLLLPLANGLRFGCE